MKLILIILSSLFSISTLASHAAASDTKVIYDCTATGHSQTMPFQLIYHWISGSVNGPAPRSFAEIVTTQLWSGDEAHYRVIYTNKDEIVGKLRPATSGGEVAILSVNWGLPELKGELKVGSLLEPANMIGKYAHYNVACAPERHETSDELAQSSHLNNLEAL